MFCAWQAPPIPETCLGLSHPPCQQPTSFRPCMPSQPSSRDWPWSSSGCMDIHTCMAVTCQVRKIITGEMKENLNFSPAHTPLPRPIVASTPGHPLWFREGGMHASMTWLDERLLGRGETHKQIDWPAYACSLWDTISLSPSTP